MITILRSLSALIFLSALLSVPAALSANLPEGTAASTGQTNVKPVAEPGDADYFEPEDGGVQRHGEDVNPVANQESYLERHKQFVDSGVLRASHWVDGFFDDPNNLAETTSTQIRIRPEFYYRKEQGAKFNLKASLKIQLPGIGRRVSFVAGSEESNEDSNGANQHAEDESIVGLQFFLFDSVKWNTSITAGVKFNDFAGLIGPRLRYQTAMGENSSMRFTQTFRWQTNNYWDIGSRVDFNFLLNQRFFFRQTVYGRWRGDESDEKGYRTRVSSVLSQKLNYTTGLQYDFSTIFHTKPDTHVDEYTLALRFRQRTSREWLYYEIVPQVSFEDEFDFKANPGIRFRVELFYGGDKTSQFWKRAAEDDENFRW